MKAVFSLQEFVQDDSIDPWSSQFSNVSSMMAHKDCTHGPVKTKDNDIRLPKKINFESEMDCMFYSSVILDSREVVVKHIKKSELYIW